MQNTKPSSPPQVEDEWTPYGYGMLMPGEWFWLAPNDSIYPLRKGEPEVKHTSNETKQPDQAPSIRITFHARKS